MIQISYRKYFDILHCNDHYLPCIARPTCHHHTLSIISGMLLNHTELYCLCTKSNPKYQQKFGPLLKYLNTRFLHNTGTSDFRPAIFSTEAIGVHLLTLSYLQLTGLCIFILCTSINIHSRSTKKYFT